ncbi:MAG: MFS transporter [Halobacteriovoraceae bacterium]|nr:MFS transporter [Halobacteriovoraceae bacterium]
MDLSYITADRRFWPLFWTQFLGALNDNVFKNALVMLITYKLSTTLFGLPSGLLVPMAGGIFILPFFIFSATAGQLADRYQKAKLIKITKVTELLVMITATIGIYSDSYQLLFLVLFMMGTQSAFFGPLKYGIIPSLIEEDELITANAFVTTGTFIAILVGTIFGGFVFESDALVSMAVLGFSGLGIVISLFIKDVPVIYPETKVDYTFFKPTWDILKLTMQDKAIFRTIMGVSWFWFLGASILSTLPTFVKEVLHGNSTVGVLFLALFTIGMGLGSVITEKISTKKVEMGMVPIAGLGMTVFLIDFCWTGSHWSATPEGQQLFTLSQFLAADPYYACRAILDLFAIATFGGGYIVPQMTYVQEISDKGVVARTIAGNNIWNALFMVSSAVFIMILGAAGLSIPMIFLALGIINFAVSGQLYRIYSKRSLRLWMWLISNVFYSFEVEGQEHIPEKGPYIIVSNHVTFIDWIFIMGCTPHPVHFVIDYNYYYLLGQKLSPLWWRQGGLIPIATRRESPEVLEKAFKNISKALEEEKVLGIFPEGWMTRDQRMRRWQPGVNKILADRPVTILPVALDGLWGSIFSYSGGRVILKMPSLRRKVKLTFLAPVSAEDYDGEQVREVVKAQVSDYLEDVESDS